MQDKNYTLEELIIVQMARDLKGEQMAVGATPLSDIAVRLAKALYEPDLVLTSGSRVSWDCGVVPKGLQDEWTAVETSPFAMDWISLFDGVMQAKLAIWIGPVQLDRHGNCNISLIGEWDKPKIQVVGSRGIPDDLWGCKNLGYHVRDHNKRSFVDEVDFVCGLGYGNRREQVGMKSGLPGLVISNLGVFDWDEEAGHMRIKTLHPGVDFAEVQEKTGFEWLPEHGREFPATPEPSEEELFWIREKIDPRGWRRMDSKEGSPKLLIELWKQEQGEVAAFRS